MSAIELSAGDQSDVLFGLNVWAQALRKALRKREDDGLNASREQKLVALQDLADRIAEQGGA